MQCRLGSQLGDTAFFGYVQAAQARDDLPNVRTPRQGGPAVMRRSSKDDARVVQCGNALGDQPLESAPAAS